MRLDEAVFSVIDVETTGLDPSADRVVECAIVTMDVDGIGGTWSKLFNPGIQIPPAASAVHHLTDADVAGCGPFGSWECLASRAIPVAHNAAFDSQFVTQVRGPWICTMRLAKKLWPTLESYGNQFLRYRLGLTIPSQFHSNMQVMHRALPDAIVTATLLLRELQELGRQMPQIETVEQLIDWLASPILLHRVGFGKHGPKGREPGMLWSDVPKDYLRWAANNLNDADEDTRFTIKHYLGQ